MIKNSKNEYDENFYYKSGDTYNQSESQVINGCLTGSTKSLYFTFFVPKSLKNVTSVTVDKMAGYLRGISGYLNSSSNTFDLTGSSYTISTNIVSEHQVNITIIASSAFSNATNNTPVAFYCNSFSLSFS